MKLTIAKKIFFGYLVMTAVTAAIGIFAVISLGVLNQLSTKIVTQDFAIQMNTKGMIDALLAQEVYERRYLLLHNSSARSLFMERDREFLDYFTAFRKISSTQVPDRKRIEDLHVAYLGLFNQAAVFLNKGDLDSADALSRGKLARTREELINILRAIQEKTLESQHQSIVISNKVGKVAFFFTLMLSIISLLFGILLTMILTNNIAGPIKKLMDATSRIGQGHFDYMPQIKQGDEVGELAKAFQNMSLHLKELEAMQLDANPLTKLPGSLAIEKQLETLISKGERFAFSLVDLDHFKAFNDRYGYARGNDVILKVADILRDEMKKVEGEGFIGHIGGDDFVLISSSEKIRELCEKIIENFDREIPRYYDKEDLNLGYIQSKNRQNMVQNFPIMTISLAVVTNEKNTYQNTIRVSEVASELKGYAKSIPRSVYVIDKRAEL